jgi:mRNA-degrading endonuclease RelE of RelBE toxin-antitoxin system
VARYRLRYSEEVRRALHRLPGNYRQRFRRILEKLPDDPYPAGSVPLRHSVPGGRKMRLDQWRLIYQVDEQAQILYVLAIRRKTGPETYQDLPEVS